MATYPTVIAFDVETTGLNPSMDRIIEIAAVRGDLSGQEFEYFEEFADPGFPIPQVVTEKTGITDAMVTGADRPLAVLQRFVEWCGHETTLVAHNASFDAEFFLKTFYRARLAAPGFWVVCTRDWARARAETFPSLQRTDRFTLDAVVRDTAFRPTHSHRALEDARASLAVAAHIYASYSQPKPAFKRRLVDISEMASPPPTQRQLAYLVDLGATAAQLEGLTKRDASALIDELKRNRPQRQSEPQQRPAKASGCAVLLAVLGGGALTTFAGLLL